MKFKFGNTPAFLPIIIIVIVAGAIVVGIMAGLKVGPFASNSVSTSVKPAVSDVKPAVSDVKPAVSDATRGVSVMPAGAKLTGQFNTNTTPPFNTTLSNGYLQWAPGSINNKSVDPTRPSNTGIGGKVIVDSRYILLPDSTYIIILSAALISGDYARISAGAGFGQVPMAILTSANRSPATYTLTFSTTTDKTKATGISSAPLQDLPGLRPSDKNIIAVDDGAQLQIWTDSPDGTAPIKIAVQLKLIDIRKL